MPDRSSDAHLHGSPTHAPVMSASFFAHALPAGPLVSAYIQLYISRIVGRGNTNTYISRMRPVHSLTNNPGTWQHMGKWGKRRRTTPGLMNSKLIETQGRMYPCPACPLLVRLKLSHQDRSHVVSDTCKGRTRPTATLLFFLPLSSQPSEIHSPNVSLQSPK